MFNLCLVSGNGDSGLPAIQRNDIQYPVGGSSRPSQDIIRHPQSPMRPTNSTSPNGMKVYILFHNILTVIYSLLYFIGLMSSGPRMLIALYDYNAREISDMSFRKGDRMELLDDRCAFNNGIFYCFINLLKFIFF